MKTAEEILNICAEKDWFLVPAEIKPNAFIVQHKDSYSIRAKEVLGLFDGECVLLSPVSGNGTSIVIFVRVDPMPDGLMEAAKALHLLREEGKVQGFDPVNYSGNFTWNNNL